MTGFDERARDWDNDPAKVERARAVAEAMRRNLPLAPGMRCLEYGCGTGLLGFALHGEVGAIALADSSEGMLAVLREKFAAAGAANMTPRKLDLAVDSLPEDRFDLVFTLMVLHHVPDTAAVLRQFHALLGPGGWLAVCDLDAEDGTFHDPGFDGHKGFDRAALAQKLEEMGFTEVRAVTAYEVTRDSPAGRKVYPLFLLVGRKPPSEG